MASEWRPREFFSTSSASVQTIGVGSMASIIPPSAFEMRCTVVVTIYVVVSVFGSELHIAKTAEKKHLTGNVLVND